MDIKRVLKIEITYISYKEKYLTPNTPMIHRKIFGQKKCIGHILYTFYVIRLCTVQNSEIRFFSNLVYFLCFQVIEMDRLRHKRVFSATSRFSV